MKVAIVENEADTAKKFKKYIERFSAERGLVCEVAVFYNAVDFLTDYASDCAAVFLDIQMPMLDGMRAAEKLRKIDQGVQIIFVTNMAQYAIRGYKVRALDFLVKPVGYFDVALEMEKLMRLSRTSPDDFLWINSAGTMRRVHFDEIRFIEIVSHDVCVHTRDETLCYRGTLKELIPKLDKNTFSRPDNCYIVNMYYVKAIKADIIYLDDGEQLHISRTRKKQFMSDLTNYINRTGGNV